MNLAMQRVCALGGIFCAVLTVLALWPAAGFFPPLRPGDSAAEIAAIYSGQATGIRIATVFILLAGAGYAAFTASIATQMRRMEAHGTPVLTYLQFASGTVVTTFFVAIAVFWSVAAFRPERNPELTQMLNDIGWFWFLMTASLPFAQASALGLAILGDRNAQPVLPRWVGYFNLWIAVLFLPGLIITFFKAGPFAWNGLFGFWIPGAAFLLWLVLIPVQLLQTIARQPRSLT